MNNFYNLVKRENETEWEFCWRCICAKIEGDVECDWQDIVESFNLPLHRDSLRKSVNVGEFSAYKVYNHMKDKMGEMKAEDLLKEAYVELELKKHELYKERVRLQDVNREINARLRWESRWEDLADRLIGAVKAQKPLPLVFRQEPYKTSVEASIMLSDWHIGLGINTPHNTFNLEVARERVEELANEVIRVCKMNEVNVLNIDMLGDLVSGTIHTTTRIYQVCDVIDQTANAIELICQFIALVSPHFTKIRLHSVAGNHDRVTANYKESLQEENWIRMIDMVVELKTGLKFERSGVDQEIETYQLENGRVVGLQHGHNFKGKLEDGVKDVTHYLRDNTNCEGIDYLEMGHFHNFRFAGGTVVNGCLCGSDQYANKARYNDVASQTLVLYHANGNQTLHNIVLN